MSLTLIFLILSRFHTLLQCISYWFWRGNFLLGRIISQTKTLKIKKNFLRLNFAITKIYVAIHAAYNFDYVLVFSLPLLRLGSKSTSLSPGFYVHWPRQYNTICWELDLVSEFFVFFPGWLFQQMESINMVGALRRHGTQTKGPTPDPKCKLIISSFCTIPD